jgi:hypothetical protein
MVYHSPLRAGHEVVLESLNTVRRSFSKRFDRSVRTVAYVSDNLMSRRCSLRKETIANSLHITAN